jgi:hypothetical protein
LTRTRGHQHDRASPARDHAPSGLARERAHRAEVGVEHLVPLLDAHRLDRRALPDAVVRDQHVERPERLLGTSHQALGLAGPGEVGAQHHSGSAHLGERLPGGGLVAAVGDRDLRAQPRHEQRRVAADAAAAAGDECVTALESQHARHAIRGRRARQGAMSR